MGNVSENLPDDVLELILEDRKAAAVNLLRQKTGLPLKAAKDCVWQAEEELGLLEDVRCPACQGTGTTRIRKAEYDPNGRYAGYRTG